MNYFSIIVITTSILLEVTAVGPRCFDCTRIPFPRDCDHVRVCGEHETCYTKQIVSDSGHVYYNTGCLDKLSCKARRSIHDVIAPQDDETGDLVTCLSCCDGEFCNSGGCGSAVIPTTNRGPICFSCPKGSSFPEKCDKVLTCGRDECPVQITEVGTIVGKRETTCFGCCDSDFCNSNCSALSPHQLVTPTKASNQGGTSTGSTGVFETTQIYSETPSSSTSGIIDRSALCQQLHQDYTYLRDFDHCVKIYNDIKLTWSQSRDRCKRDGGNLMIFHNKKEEGYFETLTEQPTNEWDTKRYWIGASDLEHEGHWLWSDNTPVDKNYFYPNEPNNGHSGHEEDCGATGFINRTFLLNDDDCDHNYHFICEVNMTAATSKTTTQSYSQCRNSHYSFSPEQGVCFHVYDDRVLTMEQARQVCQSEQADLLQLKDKNAEQFFLNYGFTDKENNHRRYWLGARKQSDGQFYWLNGHRLEDSYIWAPGEPNNFNNIEECLDLTWFAANEELHTPAAFALNDDDCRKNYFFICGDEWDTKRYWIGASDLEHEGHWLWSDNTPVDKNYFYPNEPNNGHSGHEEDCGATGFINRTFLLNDDDCDHNYHFICEVNMTAATSKTTTQSYSQCRNSHYSFSPEQGVCFHVYDDRVLTMEQARQVCQSEQADLLQLKDKNAEQFFLNYGFTDKENNHRRYWLGARKQSDGQFYWLNGHRLEDSYIWAPGEPNNFNNIEECLDLTWFAANEELHTPAAFALNDDDCRKNYFFICGEERGQ